MKVLGSLLVLMVISVLFSACALPPAIKTTTIVPARFHDATKLKEVTVLPFEGPRGRELASELEATLASINIGDKQYFSLVDRTKLDKVLSEMELSQMALVDPNAAVKVGKLVGAKGIYTGVVTASNATDGSYREERTRCAYNVTKYDKKGKAYQECGAWETYTVRCTKRIANFAFTPKLIEVATGRVVYANNVSGTATSAACSDSNAPLVSSFELAERAKQFAKAAFRKDVAPHDVSFEVNYHRPCRWHC